MELTIEKLKRIIDLDTKPKKTKKSLSPSDLNLQSLSISAAPETPTSADDVDESYSSDDGYSYLSSEVEETPPVAEAKIVHVAEEEKKRDDVTVDLMEKDYRCLQAYTVHVDGHRVLTLATSSNFIAGRWCREVLRCNRKDSQCIVGVAVDRQLRYEKEGLRDNFYELLQICVGSQCLVFELPEPGQCCDGRFPFISFFADPRIVAAGTDMDAVRLKLYRDHEIWIPRVLDLRDLAEKVLENSFELDLKRYDLDKLGTAVLGRSWFIDRPEKVKWFPMFQYWGILRMEKVMYATYDAYLCFLIGVKLLEMRSEKKKKKKKKKKNNRKKGTMKMLLVHSTNS